MLYFPLRHGCFKRDNNTLGDDLFWFVHGLRYRQQMSKRLALAGGFEAHVLDPRTTRMLMNEFHQNETRAQHTFFVCFLQIRAFNYILRGYCQNSTVARYRSNVCTNHCLEKKCNIWKLHCMEWISINVILPIYVSYYFLSGSIDHYIANQSICCLFLTFLLLLSGSIAVVLWLMQHMACDWFMIWFKFVLHLSCHVANTSDTILKTNDT